MDSGSQQTSYGREPKYNLHKKRLPSAEKQAAIEFEEPVQKRVNAHPPQRTSAILEQNSIARPTLATALTARQIEKVSAVQSSRRASEFPKIIPSPDDDVFHDGVEGYGSGGRGGRVLRSLLPPGDYENRRADRKSPCPVARWADHSEHSLVDMRDRTVSDAAPAAFGGEHEFNANALFGIVPPLPIPLLMSLLVARPNRMDLRKKLLTSGRDFGGARFDPAIVIMDLARINVWAVREVISLFAQIRPLHQPADFALLQQRGLAFDSTAKHTVADLIQFRIWGETQHSTVAGHDHILNFFMGLKAVGTKLYQSGCTRDPHVNDALWSCLHEEVSDDTRFVVREYLQGAQAVQDQIESIRGA